MKFPKLTIENFLAITNAEIALADRGLVAIQGINNADSSADSNGAGKSSIADALCWCWFGTTARGVTGDDAINEGAGKGCMVSSTVVDGGLTYTATRYRKHKTGKNALRLTMHDGLKETDLTKGTDKLTQEVANKIIGSSLDVFAGSIYAGQEKMPNLPAMTDKQLKTLIEEAAGITVLEEAYAKAREDAKVAETQHAHAVQAAAQCGDRLDQIKTQLEGAKLNAKTWDEGKAERLDATMTELRGQVAGVKQIDLELKTFDPAAIINAIQGIDKKIAGVSTEGDKLAELQNDVTRANAQVSVGQTGVEGARKELAFVDKSLAENASKIGTPCPSCARPITKNELAATEAALKKRRAEIEAEIKKSEAYSAEWTETHKKAQIALDQFRAGMTDISAEQMERKRLEEKHADYRQRASDREIALNQAKTLKARIEEIKTEQNPYAAQIEQFEKDIVDLEKTLADARSTAKGAEKALAVEKEVVRVYGPSGVRARILDQVTPFLNTQTSKYLDTLSDGHISATWTTLTPAAKKGEFKEKFTIEVKNTTGGGNFKKLSGGEKRKVRVATALALQDLVATRASKPIDLFIGDEIDDALDPAGLERLMSILEEKAKERGSVFVISHNELSDFIEQTLTIEKSATGDTVVTETRG